ncbi:MAG: hypothetical protein QOJ59_2333, partial [Thermomicrobiales bacterium]|nr:hypothetical protein [Thermomicrobiales bacterium]
VSSGIGPMGSGRRDTGHLHGRGQPGPQVSRGSAPPPDLPTVSPMGPERRHRCHNPDPIAGRTSEPVIAIGRPGAHIPEEGLDRIRTWVLYSHQAAHSVRSAGLGSTSAASVGHRPPPPGAIRPSPPPPSAASRRPPPKALTPLLRSGRGAGGEGRSRWDRTHGSRRHQPNPIPICHVEQVSKVSLPGRGKSVTPVCIGCEASQIG